MTELARFHNLWIHSFDEIVFAIVGFIIIFILMKVLDRLNDFIKYAIGLTIRVDKIIELLNIQNENKKGK